MHVATGVRGGSWGQLPQTHVLLPRLVPYVHVTPTVSVVPLA